jgi:predicted enzyme related to lactoylglutathione lyase
MITKHSFTSVYVLDQDRAKAFYTEKLGFEVRDDVTMGNFRWLTVAPKTQPDAAIILMPVQEGPMMDAEDVRAIKRLLEKGVLGGGVLDVDDCRRTYDELKAKGVTFAREPKEMPYGVEALMRDDSNNFYSMTQRHFRR